MSGSRSHATSSRSKRHRSRSRSPKRRQRSRSPRRSRSPPRHHRSRSSKSPRRDHSKSRSKSPSHRHRHHKSKKKHKHEKKEKRKKNDDDDDKDDGKKESEKKKDVSEKPNGFSFVKKTTSTSVKHCVVEKNDVEGLNTTLQIKNKMEMNVNEMKQSISSALAEARKAMAISSNVKIDEPKKQEMKKNEIPKMEMKIEKIPEEVVEKILPIMEIENIPKEMMETVEKKENDENIIMMKKKKTEEEELCRIKEKEEIEKNETIKIEMKKTMELKKSIEKNKSMDTIQKIPEPAVQQILDEESFDMFSVSATAITQAAPLVATQRMAVDWDDADGYYRSIMGEFLDNGKYQVEGNAGKGVFSSVLQCRITETPEIKVAIKLVRNNEVMRKAALMEIKILNDLHKDDPNNKKHIVRLLDTFEHRSHIAMVFECMSMNVREAMKKFGGKCGISLSSVQIFAQHMFMALSHFQTVGIVHADIKPDNMLLNDKENVLKMCDFGSAFHVNASDAGIPTPYLVSRFYRAPEIILGLPYDRAVDVWSVGCCVAEMYTGKVLFSGSSNNEMLKLFMELRGRFSTKLIKRHKTVYIEKFEMEPHFDQDNRFISRELDIVTNKPMKRILDPSKPTTDLQTLLLSSKSGNEDRTFVLQFKSFLDRILNLDANKRMTVEEALEHPFLNKSKKKENVKDE